jgi:hypothetical protein
MKGDEGHFKILINKISRGSIASMLIMQIFPYYVYVKIGRELSYSK